MEDKIKLLEEQLVGIKNRLTEKLYAQISESKELKQTIDDLNLLIATKDKAIEEYKREIATLRDAFDLLLADWIEDLEKRGVSYEVISAQRKAFDRIMYWKHGEKFE